MGSAGMLVSDLDWLSTSLDRDLAAETLTTLIPTSDPTDDGWDQPIGDPRRAERTRWLDRVASLVGGRPRGH